MEILAEKTVEVSGYSAGMENLITITLIIFLLSLFVAVFCLVTDSYSKAIKVISMISVSVLFISLFISMGLILFGGCLQEQYQEYKVIFNDKIDMNEFFEKYEIISKEGDIFTIKDKENIPIIK